MESYYVGVQHMYSNGGVYTYFECEPVDDEKFDNIDDAKKHLRDLQTDVYYKCKSLRICIG